MLDHSQSDSGIMQKNHKLDDLSRDLSAEKKTKLIPSYRRHIQNEHDEKQALAHPANASNQASGIYNTEELKEQDENGQVVEDHDDEWNESE